MSGEHLGLVGQGSSERGQCPQQKGDGGGQSDQGRSESEPAIRNQSECNQGSLETLKMDISLNLSSGSRGELLNVLDPCLGLKALLFF